MQNEAAQDTSAEIERLVREQAAELERANTQLKLEIEERERAEEALRESEQNYRTLFDNAGDAIIILDPDGTSLDVNRLMTERLGYSREEFLGMTISEIVAPEFAGLISGGIRETLENGHLLRESAHMTRDGRRIPVEVSTRIIPNQGKTAPITLARDITGRKRAEKALRESERQLQKYSPVEFSRK